MNERNAMRLLSEANPVRVEALGESPGDPLVLINAGRRKQRRRFAFGAGLLAAALAASLIGVFVVAGRNSRPIGTQTNLGMDDLAGSLPTLAHPLALAFGAKRVSLADATWRLGVPIVLPDTSLVGRADAGPVWMISTPQETVVAVTFPSAHVFVEYQTGANRYYDSVLLLYQAIAREDARSFRVIDVAGVPALAGEENSDQTGKNFGSVMFDVGGARVTVFGHYDQATLQGLAQSIVQHSQAPPAGQLGQVGGVQLFPYVPPAKQISLSDASATLGAPVVVPDSPLVKPTDVGSVWAERSCPAPDTALGRTPSCWIWLSFPSAALSVGYLRPPMYAGTRGEWRLQATHYGDDAQVVDLDRLPALAVKPQGPFPGWIEFDLGGTRIVVAGDYDEPTLQTVAQSIVDRSRS